MTVDKDKNSIRCDRDGVTPIAYYRNSYIMSDSITHLITAIFRVIHIGPGGAIIMCISQIKKYRM